MCSGHNQLQPPNKVSLVDQASTGLNQCSWLLVEANATSTQSQEIVVQSTIKAKGCGFIGLLKHSTLLVEAQAEVIQ